MIKYINMVILIIFLFLVIKIIYEYYLSNKEKAKFNIINMYRKVHKNKYISSIESIINYLSYSEIFIIKYFKMVFILIFSVILSVITFILSKKIIGITSSSVILSVYSFFIPFVVIKVFYNKFREKILKLFPSYIISLKNYTRISNDIVIAMRKSKAEKPLDLFISKFNLMIEKGVNVYDAFEFLKQEIDIKIISHFLTAVQNCYINGGDFTKLLDRYSKVLNNIVLRKEKEKQDSFSSILILIILIAINIFLIISFIFSNEEYKQIITFNFIGRMLLNINILSYLLVFYFVKKLYKMEE